jgi:hypothetical protein
MAGTQTAGFDLVMQFSESAYRELLGVFFDESGILGSIVDLIPGVDANEFTIDVSLDQPTDVTLPSGAENPLDIQMGIGAGGSLASLRMVVGMNVDRTESDRDKVQIDFENSLYHAGVRVGSTNIPIPNLETRLAGIIPTIPVLPVPVDRASTSPTQITRVDFKIVDDTSPADLDATAAMFTFGGGTAGDSNALQRFVPAGGRGGIGIFFEWLCRMAVPRLESALELPSGSFDISPNRCALNRSVTVDDDEDVELTSLVLSLQDGFIDVSARVAKDGFCYEASGDVGARLRLAVTGGRLVASVEINDPDVDVDIPWYCWLAGAVIGAVIGGVLLGVVGAIVGAVLVPLITYIASEVIEGTIEEVAGRISDAINDALPDVDVPAFGINILFDEVFIDDVVLRARLAVESHAPVRTQGTVILHNNRGICLDSGEVVSAATPEADLRWVGRRDRRKLETGCQAGLARTGTTDFTGLARYELYAFSFNTPTAVPLWELGLENPLSFLIGNEFFEYKRVYAVRTNEGRYAIVQVVEIEDGYIRLRYKTFERRVLSVSISGHFKCVKQFVAPKEAAVKFVPEHFHAGVVGSELFRRDLVAVAKAEAHQEAIARAPDTSLSARIVSARMQSIAAVDEDELDHPTAMVRSRQPSPCERATAIAPLHDGRWIAQFKTRQMAQARLEAVTSGTVGEVEYIWLIGGEKLVGSSGTRKVNGVDVSYRVAGNRLILTVDKDAKIQLYVEVQVIDKLGCSTGASKCVRHDGRCPIRVRYIPGWKQFKAVQAVPAEAVSSVTLASASMDEAIQVASID